MFSGWKQAAAAGMVVCAALAGCSPDRPHGYGQQRQPIDELNPNDSGLQSKDVVDAADRVSRDLLADPRLNASNTAWTIVVSNMEDKTIDRSFAVNFDIFLQALKGDLARRSDGRIQLIENKAQFNNLRNKELEKERDDFGQNGNVGRAPQATNPDYALYGTAMDMPNRATNYYQIEFQLTNLQTRAIAFDRLYQVKVAR